MACACTHTHTHAYTHTHTHTHTHLGLLALRVHIASPRSLCPGCRSFGPEGHINVSIGDCVHLRARTRSGVCVSAHSECGRTRSCTQADGCAGAGTVAACTRPCARLASTGTWHCALLLAAAQTQHRGADGRRPAGQRQSGRMVRPCSRTGGQRTCTECRHDQHCSSRARASESASVSQANGRLPRACRCSRRAVLAREGKGACRASAMAPTGHCRLQRRPHPVFLLVSPRCDVTDVRLAHEHDMFVGRGRVTGVTAPQQPGTVERGFPPSPRRRHRRSRPARRAGLTRSGCRRRHRRERTAYASISFRALLPRLPTARKRASDDASAPCKLKSPRERPCRKAGRASVTMLGNKLGRFFLGKRSVLRASAEQHTGDAAEGSSHAPDLEHMARQIEHLQRELSLARAQASATSSQQRQSHRSSGRSALAPRDLERAPPAGERSENSTAHGASRSYYAHPEEEPGQGISEGSASSLAPEILRLNRMLKRREEQQEEEDRRFRLMMSSIKTTLEGTLTETEARQREALKQRSHRGRKLSFSRDRQRSPSPVGVFTPLSANHGPGTSGAHETSPSNGRTADLSALSLKGTAQRDRARDGARDGEPCAYLRYSATDVEGRKCYAGQLKSGLRHGLGRLECVDGSTYTGDWLDDHPCGYGIETYSDGSAYTGSFRDDLRHGYGEFLTPSGACYSGQFEKGEMHGTVFIKEVDSRGAECEVSARADHGNIYREPDW